MTATIATATTARASARIADPDSTTSVAVVSDTEIVITRDFNAPAALVWEAWTRPEHVRRWYGLRGSNLSVCEIDLRVGGSWRYVIREGDAEYPFSGEYLELDAPRRLVSTERFELIPNSDYVATVTLDERDGRTTMRNHLKYQSREHRDGHLSSGMEGGMRQTFQRLDAVLDDLQSDSAPREIVQTRYLNAPRDLVFDAFTSPAHVDHWWGPRGFTTRTHSMDVRPGGEWRFDMTMENGPTFPNTVKYLEVVRPERLVYEHGGGEGNDHSFHVTVTLTEEAGKTHFLMRQVFPSAAAREFVAREFNAVESGKQTIDRLEEWLASVATPAA
jgi:uncharacterized protein YndB with AHSA1/START domain